MFCKVPWLELSGSVDDGISILLLLLTEEFLDNKFLTLSSHCLGSLQLKLKFAALSPLKEMLTEFPPSKQFCFC